MARIVSQVVDSLNYNQLVDLLPYDYNSSLALVWDFYLHFIKRHSRSLYNKLGVALYTVHYSRATRETHLGSTKSVRDIIISSYNVDYSVCVLNYLKCAKPFFCFAGFTKRFC